MQPLTLRQVGGCRPSIRSTTGTASSHWCLATIANVQDLGTEAGGEGTRLRGSARGATSCSRARNPLRGRLPRSLWPDACSHCSGVPAHWPRSLLLSKLARVPVTVTVRTATARASTRTDRHKLSLAPQSGRSPRCERVAGRSIEAIQAGRSVDAGRSRAP